MAVLIVGREYLAEHQLWIDFGRMSCWRCGHTWPALDGPAVEVGELVAHIVATGWQSLDGFDECPGCIAGDGTLGGEERTGPAGVEERG